MENLFPPPVVKRLGTNKARLIYAMQVYCDRGMTLAHIGQKHILNRSLSVLKRYARENHLAFPDYIPRAMKAPPPE